MSEILVVDDKQSILDTLELILRKQGYGVHLASELGQAKGVLDAQDVDVVITDLRLGKASGEDLIEYLHEQGHTAGCIVMTGFGSIESAVNCMRLGAFDYLTKPVSPPELLIRIDRVLAKNRLTDEVKRLREQVQAQTVLTKVVAKSPQMRQVLERIQRIRDKDLPVLITGETGTGKELVARAVHDSSRRADGPFVAINCCTLPEDLLDSELFGHVRGAFTGANRDSKGLFQQADTGTLFLDEIGDISPRLQSKLLRVLQENEVRPVGGERAEKIDVRIVAATNRDLPQMMTSGDFRSDLYYRLNVVPIAIAPLRERREDIGALIEHFAERIRAGSELPLPRLSKSAVNKLLGYDYPGNVRQLENMLERTFALSEGTHLEPEDIQFDYESVESRPGATEPDSEVIELDNLVNRHIQKILDRHQGNQVAAARALGISRSTLRRKLGLS